MGATNPTDFAGALTADSLAASPDAFVIVAGTAFTTSAGYTVPMVRALRAQSAGNVTCTTAKGQSRVLKFLAGETRYVAVKSVESMTVTAGDLEGLV